MAARPRPPSGAVGGDAADTTAPRKRPGGRSTRVQQAVHHAVAELLAAGGRPTLSVPVIAERAGVTPSTIYRRWGSLADLLADVAAERLRPDGPPADTGSLRSDLGAWVRDYLEELSSPDGQAFLRDVVAGRSETACRCGAATREQMEVILDRAGGRGDAVPSAQEVVDHVVAPLVYALLFDDPVPAPHRADTLVARLLERRDPASTGGRAP